MKSKVAEKILSETSDETKEKAINYGNNIMKKPAVEWLKMMYEKHSNLSTLDFKIAKEMEKQQLEKIAIHFINYSIDVLEDKSEIGSKKEFDKYFNLNFSNKNIIDEWLDKNGCSEIKKQVKDEALELFKQNIIEDVFEWLTTHNYLTDLKETLIENYNNFKNK